MPDEPQQNGSDRGPSETELPGPSGTAGGAADGPAPVRHWRPDPHHHVLLLREWAEPTGFGERVRLRLSSLFLLVTAVAALLVELKTQPSGQTQYTIANVAQCKAAEATAANGAAVGAAIALASLIVALTRRFALFAAGHIVLILLGLFLLAFASCSSVLCQVN